MTTGPTPQDAAAARGYPVQFAVEYPDRPLNRLTTAFRPFVAIPIVIVLVTIGGVEADWTEGNRDLTVGTLGGILFVPPLLMIVVRQKYPRWWFDFNLELQRFTNRVGAYLALMNDRYRSTDDKQYVTLEIPYPDAQRGRSSPTLRRSPRGLPVATIRLRRGPHPATWRGYWNPSSGCSPRGAHRPPAPNRKPPPRPGGARARPGSRVSQPATALRLIPAEPLPAAFMQRR